MQKEIQKINKLLVSHFGVPSRAEILPNPLDMLIATILSQNTNDNNSYKAYNKLKSRFQNWDEVRKAGRISIEKEIKIAGLGLQKSTAIKNLLVELHKKNNNYSLQNVIDFNNETALKYLTSFKGVGVKTASCVLLFSLDRDICPVDTHVHRTLNRIGSVNTKTPDKTFLEINRKFPPEIAHSFHTNLIRLGREICKPTGYSCTKCPLLKICRFNEKHFGSNTISKERAFMLLDNV